MAGPRGEFTEDEKSLIVALYGEGKTDAEIAKVLKIPRKTLSDRVKYNNLTALMKKAKLPATEKVVMSLLCKLLSTFFFFMICFSTILTKGGAGCKMRLIIFFQAISDSREQGVKPEGLGRVTLNQ
jgi:hypothetical protein